MPAAVAQAVLTPDDPATLEPLGAVAVKEPAGLEAPERLRFRGLVLPWKRGRLRWRPAGPVAVGAPRNFSIQVSFSQLATAVTTGGAVVLEPSEHAHLVRRAAR